MKTGFQDIPVPEELNQVVEKNLNRIYSEEKRRKFHNGVAGFGAAAAVVAGGIFLGMHTPVLAENAPRLLENIPILRGIFVDIQDDFAYSGDYEYVGEALPDMYTETVNGVTVTLSEIYCNDQALYVSFTMESEDVIPDTDLLNCLTVKATGDLSYWDPGHYEGANTLDYSDGTARRIDDHTLAGVVRFDLQRTKVDISAYDEAKEQAISAGEQWVEHFDAEVTEKYFTEKEIPENFTMELGIQSICLWEEGSGIDNIKSFSGPWTFALNVNKNTSDIQVIETGVNEAGIGFEKIVKDRFEIVLYDTVPTELRMNHIDYAPIMLDANGELLSSAGVGVGTMNVVAIGDHDISHADAFMVSDEIWFNELKPLYWNSHEDDTFDGEAFRELLLEKCAYHQEIVFEE